jgi:predicted Holliday junction resolvase-like endonuclease
MDKELILTITGVGLLVILVLAGLAIGLPYYNVWSMEMSGKAQLAEAEWNRQIQIREAEANLESERLNAQAEVERAKGMAESIDIESGKLTETYIKYLWVRQNQFNDKTTIYIPTEANLPILEARN